MNELNNSTNQVPLVSIVCITYNQETYITHAIKGFLMQKTNFPFEIIIHDDASTDKTAEIIRLYQIKFPELFKCVFQTENQYSKKNGAIENIIFSVPRGKYIAFCEGDDFWTDPNKLQKQVDYLEANENISFCFHNAITYYVDSDISEDFNKNLKSKTYNTKDLLLKSWFIPTASLLFRKEMLPNPLPKWYFKVNSGDYALELILSNKGDYYYINEKMSTYRKNSINSLSASQINSFHHLQKKIVLLQSFAKSQRFMIKLEVKIAIFNTRLQIFRAKIYSAYPILFTFKESIKKINLKSQLTQP